MVSQGQKCQKDFYVKETGLHSMGDRESTRVLELRSKLVSLILREITLEAVCRAQWQGKTRKEGQVEEGHHANLRK